MRKCVIMGVQGRGKGSIAHTIQLGVERDVGTRVLQGCSRRAVLNGRPDQHIGDAAAEVAESALALRWIDRVVDSHPAGGTSAPGKSR
jgi:hypothetical protein